MKPRLTFRISAAWLLGCALLVAAAPARAVEIAVDRTTKYQTIEGFGFFGAMDDWWSTPPNLINDAWATLALTDLGITLWRNEYYPPADNLDLQDADWSKQMPVVQTLKRIADANGIPLRTLLTVWSPPSAMKCLVQTGTWLPVEGTAPQSTKGGNTLCQNSWSAFAAWLVAGLQMYRNIGVEVYGLSFQNEPNFWQSYNSCFYLQSYYAQSLAYLGPRIKAAFPKVKLFGAENMLEMEAGSDKDYFYTAEIRNNATAAAAIDALAVHGYSDGVVPTSTSVMSTLWSTMSSSFALPMGKPLWMTETSGYVDTWTASAAADGTVYPGAGDLAYAMYAALYYGHASAWVWWQGSEMAGYGPYSLMAGTSSLSKRYYVSKQFFRFIRPGATMVKTTSSDGTVLAAAFDNLALGALTVVLINTTAQAQPANVSGFAVPGLFDLYRTSAGENCVYKGTVSATGLTLPANSVSTLVYGPFREPVPVGGGGPVPVPALPRPLLAIAAMLLFGAGYVGARSRGGGRPAG